MQIGGTREAFEALISQRGIYKLLGVQRSTVANWKVYLKEGKSISLDKMEEMLVKAGAIVIQGKVWKLTEREPTKDFAIRSSIKPTDVRVGNLLECMYNGKTVKVVDLDVLEVLSTSAGTQYSGLKLTEDWLVKFGFEKWILESNESCSYYKHGVLNLMKSDSLSYGCSFEPENNHSWFTEIKHIHQLQNLYFSLTGHELTIKNTGV